MRGLFFFILVVGLVLASIVMFDINWGNVTLWVPPVRIDMSLQVALIAVLALFVVLVILARIVIELASIPSRVRRYRMRRLQDQRLQRLAGMMVDFFEGRFARVVKAARGMRDDRALIQEAPSALVAAQALAATAAHRMRDAALRHTLLIELRGGGAADRTSDPRLAGLLEAEFAVDDYRGHQALTALAPLTEGDRRQLHTLRLALRANRQQGRWDEVLRIGRLLENRKAISRVVATEYKREVADAWIAQGRHAQAIELIESALKREWDSGLAMLYGRCKGNSREQLQRLETWLQQQPRDAELNWSLGRICQRQALWGKARMHLEASLRFKPMAQTHVALAEIAESLSEKETAASHWKAAARLTT